MNYEEAVSYIEELTRQRKIVLGLDSMKRLLARLGDPQDRLKFIHIAGTNGKGSTLAMVASILNEAGLKVGQYNSPSVFSYCEKIRCGGEAISQADAARLITKVCEVSDALEAEGLGRPTAFETETAVGFLYFAEQGCDLVALETGMGGETDATNVVTTTLVSIIAPVSMDHMQFLGNSIAEIAKVKGGIIKESRAVVLCGQSEEASRVIRRICEEKHALLRESVPDQVTVRSCGPDGTVFDYRGWKALTLSLLGEYQTINASAALETVEILRQMGYDIGDDAVRRGLAHVVWPGRFQKVLDRPAFFIDGAHNPDAARRLAESVNLYFTNKRILYIMGILADKDYREVTRIMLPYAAEIYTVTPDNARALSAEALKQCILEESEKQGLHLKVTEKKDLDQAVKDALDWAGKDDVVLAFGSLSYLGALTETIKENIHG